jgi:queuine/archaeosine tRNA-ribosyltransferase
MKKVRQSIKLGNFGEFRRDFLNKISEGESEDKSTDV